MPQGNESTTTILTIFYIHPLLKCSPGKLIARRGIEVGHVFYLGTKYSEPLGARLQVPVESVDGVPRLEERAIEMGCYGLGMSRIMAAVVEASHDTKGIK